MQVVLDGSTVEVETHGESLHDLIGRVQESHASGRIVVAVSIDAKVLVDHELTDRLRVTVRPDEQIVLESADPREIVAGALREVTQSLKSGRESLKALTQLVVEGTDSAAAPFSEYLDRWRLAQRTIVEASSLLGTDLTARPLNGVPIVEHLTALVEQLKDLRNAFEAKDMVLLSDMIAYEWPELSETWERAFDELATSVLADIPSSTSAETVSS